MGAVLIHRGDLAGAGAAYRAATAADPQHAVAHSNLGNVLAESAGTLPALLTRSQPHWRSTPPVQAPRKICSERSAC